jgi:uncharacterized protein YggU (UPF0235/DUF167 family)
VGEHEVRFRVRLTPRGGADRVDGVEGGVLRARVAAAPADGAANAALVRLIADELDVARSSVRIASGASSRSKVIAVTGVEAARIRARWPDLVV